LNKQWYVLRSKPNKESFLAGQLESRNVDYYVPLLKVRPANPRCRKIKPYFPGYIFVHTDLSINNSVLFERIPGAMGLVSLGGELSFVPENILQMIRNRVDEINENGGELLGSLKTGDRVKIHTGPFEGYEAVFDLRISGTERVKVFLEMLKGRKLLIEMPVRFVSAKKAPSISR
jgi:transcriptional antiterminator RfaH